jgi:hypothetical protein
MVEENWLLRHVFSFEAGPDRNVISSNFLFESNGTIDGYYHPNESRWAIEGDNLLIIGIDGTVTCRAQLVENSNNSTELVGKFLLFSNEHLHYFRPIASRRELSYIQSFDLFDTLIARYCARPAAIFESVESKSLYKNFAKIRENIERDLWNNGDYTFDDIYDQILIHTGWTTQQINHLKILELAEEWKNIFPIAETVSKVHPGDIIITDMYLPYSFIENIVYKKCGLQGISIFLSSHGKSHGTIWPKVKTQNTILRHYGDNLHSDVNQAKKHDITPIHVSLHNWTFSENALNSAGMVDYSKVIRKCRLSTFTFDKVMRESQLVQYELNIPFLFLSSILLIRHAKKIKATTLLMCGRDCNLWIGLMRYVVSLSDYKPEINYFPSSRELFLKNDPNYLAYFHHIRGDRNIIVDISGTGRTPTNFIAKIGAQLDTSVYLAILSDDVAPHMEDLAPARNDVDIEYGIKDNYNRLFIEKINSAIECRAIGVEFDGQEFKIQRDNSNELSPYNEKIVAMMHAAFADVMLELNNAAVGFLPHQVSDSQLKQIMEELIRSCTKYRHLLKIL